MITILINAHSLFSGLVVFFIIFIIMFIIQAFSMELSKRAHATNVVYCPLLCSYATTKYASRPI